MCGITGFFSYKNKIETKKYYDAHMKIAHRGPDDEGFIYKNREHNIEFLAGNDTVKDIKNKLLIYDQEPSSLILGHRRLSIIDLSSHGHQPFTFEGLSLVYNGEIYNYIELRNELINLGYIFKTDSDTEVFLKAFHCWGEESFNKFNGMWAAAIYNKKQNTVLLTRDRFGIKPLYYSIVDDNLIFGSEIKFVASFFDNLNANKQMVYEYLRFNHIDHTNQTLFKNILQLEPANYMIYSDSGLHTQHYWDMQDEENASKDLIERRIIDAIELRMRSDVEVGSLLSGGIDSSTIVGTINTSKLTDKLQTFSAVFKEEQFSEKKYIDKFTTENIDLKKHFIYPDPNDLIKLIDELIYTQEEPFRSLAVFSQYEIYKYIHTHTSTTVLLNGQGADEIFTGYTEYHYIYLLELLQELKFRQFLKELKYFSKNRGLTKTSVIKRTLISFLKMFFDHSDKYHIFNENFQAIHKEKKFNTQLKNSLWNSLTFSALREYLRYEDKNSMRFSLESRLPFLDYRLVQSAFSLKSSDKIKDGVSKYILRKIAQNKIPDETLNRKDKMGFVSPQEVWQKSVFMDEFDTVFEDIKQNGIFEFIDNAKIAVLYKGYRDNKFTDWAFIWRVYCLYKWKKIWKIAF